MNKCKEKTDYKYSEKRYTAEIKIKKNSIRCINIYLCELGDSSSQ